MRLEVVYQGITTCAHRQSSFTGMASSGQVGVNLRQFGIIWDARGGGGPLTVTGK
jgi:hypothetical protein